MDTGIRKAHKPAIHLDLLPACFDFSTNVIDLDAPNRYRKAYNDLATARSRVPAKERSKVQMKQIQRIVHFQFSKFQSEERNAMTQRLIGSVGNKIPHEHYLPKVAGTMVTIRGKSVGFLRAPASSNRVFRLKRGMILFEVLDPFTQESARRNIHGVSSLYVSHCFNGLPFYAIDRFVGISQTESSGDKPDLVREDGVAATSGTDKILNSGSMSIPVGVYCYYSRLPWMTVDDQGRVIPVIDTDTGDGGAGIHGETFLPAIFYLHDNNVASMEKRIDENLQRALAEIEFKNRDMDYSDTDKFRELLSQYNSVLGDLCDRRCKTFELRQDFVMYELGILKAYLLILQRVDVYPWKLHRKAYAAALFEALVFGARALSFFGRERAEIVVDQYNGFFSGNNNARYVLTSDYLYGQEQLEEKLKEYADQMELLEQTEDREAIEEIITELLNKRFWLHTRITSAVALCRAEALKILKNRYIGISRSAAEPGEWFELEINA